ncbi:MAG: hypothetical protein M1830_009971 [Pleopsidium flavum]|nr:MAG: hypothetical protein M1830_009971 [Pleopsidium flavum]
MTAQRLLQSLRMTQNLMQTIQINKEFLMRERKFDAVALPSIPRLAGPAYNARSALLRDIEKVQQNLKDIQDQNFRTKYAKMFAHTETLRIQRNSSAHDESVANREQNFDWDEVIKICEVVYPDIQSTLNVALSDLAQQVTNPQR